MKDASRKLSSLLLALAMAASVFAPCALAEETAAAAEIAAEAEQPAGPAEPEAVPVPEQPATEVEIAPAPEVSPEIAPEAAPAPEVPGTEFLAPGTPAEDPAPAMPEMAEATLPADTAEATPTEAVEEEAAETFAAPLSLSGPTARTEAEVLSAYRKSYVDVGKAVTYTTQPDLSGAYNTAGEVSADDLDDALKTVNLVRYVAGLDSVTTDSEYTKKAQYGCALMAASTQYGHYPEQPDGCPDAFYMAALTGTFSSNIGMGFDNIAHSVLYGYMEDGGSSNISAIGHRRWLLNPSMGKTGFGFATGTDGKSRTATYAIDSSNTASAKPGYVAWPAGVTPYDVWSGPMSFQIYSKLGGSISNASATVTSALEDKTYTFDSTSNAAGTGVFYVNTAGYGGDRGCIIFGKAENEKFAVEDTLTVTVAFKAGSTDYSTTYTVKLLDMNKYPDTPHLNGYYTLSFDANGGTAVTQTNNIKFGSTFNRNWPTDYSCVELNWPNPERAGYVFSGWYTEKEGGTEVKASDVVAVRANPTLYAHWVREYHTVTFDANGGQTDTASKQVARNDIYGDMPAATRTGYTFLGWFTDKMFGYEITSDFVVTITTEQTLYAHWQANHYTLTFDANGGTAIAQTSTIEAGYEYRWNWSSDGNMGVYIYRWPSTRRDGYTFTGWYTDKTGGTLVNGTDTVSVGSDTTLYAHWEPVPGAATPKPTTAPAAPAGGASAAPSAAGTGGFVDRLYSVCLGRKPDAAGKADWVNQLTSFRISGSKAAYGFIFSPEFQNKKYSNEDYVEHLYEAFMDRKSDAAGKADWVKQLQSGKSRQEVFNGFANSVEFDKICTSYGIVSKDVETFVTRFYSVCLGRKPDANGLADWSGKLRSKQKTGRDVAYGFIFSKEFTGKNYSNEDYVEHLYAAFMGRASDAAGKADWVKQLQSGKSRQDVFNGFVGSKEFSDICASYDIARG